MSRAEWVSGLLALILALLHLVLAPNSGTDLAAQLGRASFARVAPLTPVDLSWYSGIHPFGYSLLSPWIMATFGVAIPGILAAVATAVLLARLLRGSRWAIASGALGAVFAVGDVVDGRTTFALAAVALLAAVLLSERRGWAACCAVISALLSPVAAMFLGLIAAVLVLHRRPGGWTLGLAATLPVLALALLFPVGGVQPFSVRSASFGLLVAGLVVVLTGVSVVRTGALLYAGAILLLVAIDDPIGSNILRLGLLVAAPVLLSTLRRQTLVGVLAVAGILVWQVAPILSDLRAQPGPHLEAMTGELVALGSFRAEVVAPRGHLESWIVAEQVPLARGWNRQIDVRDNPIFYRDNLTAHDYLAWLHDQAVDHVAVPRTAPVDFGSARELVLLRQRVAGLTRVWSDRDWTVYAVDEPRSIAGGAATVRSFTRTSLTVSSPAAGDVELSIRWSHWLTVTGPGCVWTDGRHVKVRFSKPGTVVVGSSLLPSGHC